VVGAVNAGVRRFAASLGGLGGCPFAPGATGNINTEDCVFLLESLGFHTGIHVEALVALRTTVESWLPAERFSGAIARAGLPKTFKVPVETAA
ncbi:MAG: hydroxymethylglutaryl-CoA lyase, partial [Hyphomicrobiaceae bacterium]|nr:hydroxymethylglutaryl-CoA lyase [Hyphomicrobiaceae bacterium]